MTAPSWPSHPDDVGQVADRLAQRVWMLLPVPPSASEVQGLVSTEVARWLPAGEPINCLNFKRGILEYKDFHTLADFEPHLPAGYRALVESLPDETSDEQILWVFRRVFAEFVDALVLYDLNRPLAATEIRVGRQQ